jgi:predicted dehydrogenase
VHDTIEVGLIGYGLGGATFHAPFIATTPGLHLSAVMTSDAARRSAATERYPDARVVSTLDELLGGAPRLDLIAISTPNATHVPLARAVLESGRHVVVDKPFAGTSAEAREIAALAARVGKMAIPFQNRRWDGDFLTLQRLMREGALGDIHRFESRFDRWRPVAKPGWCLPDARARHEGILHDLGTHLIDQALVLLGPVANVYAELRRLDPAVKVADDAFVSMAHASGARSHLHMTTKAGIQVPRMSVFGTRAAYVKHGLDVQEDALRAGMWPGAAHYGDEPRERWGVLGTGDAVARVPTETGSYPSFYAGVAAAIGAGAPPPVEIADVVAGLEIIEAAFRSAERGEVVALGPSA